MDEDAFNMSVRRFLKRVGISSQREIESAVRQALEKGDIDQDGVFRVSVQLNIELSDKPLVIEDEVKLA